MTDDQTTENLSSKKSAGSAIGSVASDIKAAAAHRLDQAVTDMRGKADHAKDDVADDVKDVATALRRASEELRGGSAQERTLGTIAGGLADASESIRDKDLGQILQMVSKVGRDNPALFLGGAALLGFMASRYAKASGRHDETSDAHSRALQDRPVENFVDEGNPNTQPVSAAP